MLGFLTTKYEEGLVYDGTNINVVLDGPSAVKFHKENPKYSIYKIPSLYGKQYSFKFPDWGYKEAPKGWKNITYDWYEKVLNLSELGYVTDFTLGAHKALIENFDIYVLTTPENEEHYQLIPKISNELMEDLESEDEIISQTALNKINNMRRILTDVDGVYIMMKERLMDYHQPKPINYRPTKGSKQKTFQIGQNYEYKVQGRDTPVIIDNNYTTALRYNMFHRALEEWNSNPRYKNYQRSNLLQWRQIDALKRMGRRTVILCPRRAGKTVLVSSEILKELLSVNYKSATRPRTVLFISKAFDAVDQVMDYINGLIAEFDWMKDMFHYDTQKHILSLRTFDERGKQITLSQCKFYSALGTLPGVGDAADAVFFDEAMYIPTYVKDNLMKIVTNEGARLLVVSTFYDEDTDGSQKIYYRPIDLCNKFEKESSKIVDINSHIMSLWNRYNITGEMPDECTGLRYTIDDVEVIIHKDIAKEELQDKPDSYMRQLYCRMAEKKGVLNYKPYLLNVKFETDPYPVYKLGDQILKPDFKRIVTGYDPAQTNDISAFLASGYDQKRNKIVIFKERQMNFKDKSSFIPQAQLIKEALKDLEKFNCPILKCIDSTHQAVVDVMRGQRIFFQYLYFWIGGDTVRKGVRPSEERVPKKLMVEAAQTMFDNGMVEIRMEGCPQLIEQLSEFVEYKNVYTNMSKFQAKGGGHDDFVACLLMILRTYWSHLGLSHNNFKIDTVAEYNMKKEEDPDPLHLLDPDPDYSNRPVYTNIKNAFWY